MAETQKGHAMRFFQALTGGSSNSELKNVPRSSQLAASNTSGDVLISMSLELFQANKEYRPLAEFQSAIQKAREIIDLQGQFDAIVIFKPFEMACQSKSTELVTISIDSLGKLFTYNYWSYLSTNYKEIVFLPPKEQQPEPDELMLPTLKSPTIEKDVVRDIIAYVIEMISNSFAGQATHEKVQLQIIKALQSAVSIPDPAFSLQGTALLQAIRTTYNIFLLSKLDNVQIAAQNMVLQMIQTVFSRIQPPNAAPAVAHKRYSLHNLSQTAIAEEPSANVRNETQPESSAAVYLYAQELRDAYKVFRTLCVLSIKAIPKPEGEIDLRSQIFRSKILSLNLISNLIKSHSYVFKMLAPTLYDSSKSENIPEASFRFIDSIKEYLIVSLSRNATSFIIPIYQAAFDIFIALFNNLRPYLKHEIQVFCSEIIVGNLEAKNAIPFCQRTCLLENLYAIIEEDGGKKLVELYLNYDCYDGMENLWEKIIHGVGKLTAQHVANAKSSRQNTPLKFYQTIAPIPALNFSNLVLLTSSQVREMLSLDGDQEIIRKAGVQFLINGCLKALWEWCKVDTFSNEQKRYEAILEHEPSEELKGDDPKLFENLKTGKKNTIEGIAKFNIDPNQGISFLIEREVIQNNSPKDIAAFLYQNHGSLDPFLLGNFLGEGDEHSINIMYAYLDNFEFRGLKFVDAIRKLLSSFMLPGEAQKIDRFMLKFSEIYVNDNPKVFGSADSAYILAYSIIMLNTDLHNSQVKRKMSKEDFVKNNRGIEGAKDLPDTFFLEIYEDIERNEIQLRKKQNKSEKQETLPTHSRNVSETVDRSEERAIKTEDRFRKQLESTKETVKEPQYIHATNYSHVKPMFELTWMSFLTAISAVIQESRNPATMELCMEGITYATRMACFFGMHMEKQALFSAINSFTHLNSGQESEPINIDAVKILLSIATTDGEQLGTSWKDVIGCISRLEIRDMINISSANEGKSSGKKKPNVIGASKSQGLVLLVDRIFTSSVNLSGEAIVHFVSALCEISWEEITTSGNGEHPQTYCLEKIVEICYYNMNRVRVEWNNIWAILGHHFEKAGCHPNSNVAMFTVDKLRQLSTKFLDLEELPKFTFQKDFLQPFETIMRVNGDINIKEMCLICIQKIIQMKENCLKSGWKILLAAIGSAANEYYEPLVTFAYNIILSIANNSILNILTNGCSSEFIACASMFLTTKKVTMYNVTGFELFKRALSFISAYCQTKSLEPHDPKKHELFSSTADMQIKCWLPYFYGLSDLVVSGVSEVRTIALDLLFETLIKEGKNFEEQTWEVTMNGTVFPIFDVLKIESSNRFENSADYNTYLTTTIIQAIRKLMNLFNQFHVELEFLQQKFWVTLQETIIHENETLSRIGITCVMQYLENNAKKLKKEQWLMITNALQSMCVLSLPTFLFFNYDPDNIKDISTIFPDTIKPQQVFPDKVKFQKDLKKCATHILVMQMLIDILSIGGERLFYRQIPDEGKLLLLNSFDQSYTIARIFNESIGLRQSLYNRGYMKQLPNLLKQETMSVNAYITYLFEYYNYANDGIQHEMRLLKLCHASFQRYNTPDLDSSQRSIQTWRPVIVRILAEVNALSDEKFSKFHKEFYMPIIDTLTHEMPQDVRHHCMAVLKRIGTIYGLYSENKTV